MKLSIKQGATSVTVNIFLADSSSTTGAGLTGLVFNSSGLVAYYMRPKVAATAITLATLAAVTSAYSSGGFKEIDSANAPGWYRFDIPDAVIANAERFVSIHFKGATNLAPLPLEIALESWDNQTAISPTGDSYTRLGAPAGASAAADIASIKTDTGTTIPGRLPAALVSGRIDASVGAMAANVLTATAINADAITAAKIADGAIDAATFAASAINAAAIAADAITAAKIADGAIDAATFAAGAINAAAIAADAITDAKVAADVTIASVTGAVGSVTGAVGSVTGLTASNLDTTVSSRLASSSYTSPPSAATIAAAVWDYLTSAATTVGSMGKWILDKMDVVVSTRGTGTALDAAGVRTAVGLASANLDTQLDALPTNTELTAALNTLLTTAMTESYSADGATMTPAQALYELRALLSEFAIVGTTMTVRKKDGTTQAFVLTLDDATSPTSVTRTA